MIGWLVEQQDVGGADELTCESEPSTLATAQLSQWLTACLFRIEAESVQHGINPRGERVSVLTLETLQIAVVALEHLLRYRLACLRQFLCLLGERPFQCEQLGKLTRRSFPNRVSADEGTMLFEKCDAKTRLPGNDARSRLLCAGDHTEQRRLTTTVASEDSPTLAARNGEGNPRKNCSGSELDAEVGDRELSQERKTVEQALRQRWIVSTV